ncbi:hypothetical protein NAL19_975 [Pectobacterium sp. F1-1]|nr:hypothetical protein NAL19_975 [Pectobacterium sp. F1-1]
MNKHQGFTIASKTVCNFMNRKHYFLIYGGFFSSSKMSFTHFFMGSAQRCPQKK